MYPTRYVVEWLAFDPGFSDELGNQAPAWYPPVSRKVIGWAPTITEKLGEYESRQITVIDLLVPPDFLYSLQDRCVLPEGLFEVIEGEDYTHGFAGWKPGKTVRLKMVTG